MRIADVMSPCAYTIPASDSLDAAQRLMDLHGFRHLPVIDEGDLIGILTERDIVLARSIRADPSVVVNCGQACSPSFVSVQSNERVIDVVELMAQRKLDCVLVSDDKERFVGIFTTTDVCRLLILALEERGDG